MSAQTSDDALLSARAASRKLGVSRSTFARYVKGGIFRGVKDPVSGRVRYHIPTIRQQFAEAADS